MTIELTTTKQTMICSFVNQLLGCVIFSILTYIYILSLIIDINCVGICNQPLHKHDNHNHYHFDDGCVCCAFNSVYRLVVFSEAILAQRPLLVHSNYKLEYKPKTPPKNTPLKHTKQNTPKTHNTRLTRLRHAQRTCNGMSPQDGRRIVFDLSSDAIQF